MQYILKLILFAGFFTSILGNAQEKNINLDLLFDKWDISQEATIGNDLVVMRSLKNSRNTYDFKIGMDSIICEKTILSKRIGCGTPPFPKREKMGKEVWTLDVQKTNLRYDIYFDSIVGKTTADYSIIYKIVALNNSYLKLRAEKELFEGEE